MQQAFLLIQISLVKHVFRKAQIYDWDIWQCILNVSIINIYVWVYTLYLCIYAVTVHKEIFYNFSSSITSLPVFGYCI